VACDKKEFKNWTPANLSYILCPAGLFISEEIHHSRANLSRANLYEAKIKITQKDEIIKALKIEIVE